MSVPFVLLNDSMSKVFANTSDKIESVWTYDAESSRWYIFTPDNTANDNLLEMLPGWGYWILAKNDTVINVGGSLFSPLITPPEKIIVEGWNLIGYYGTENSAGLPIFNYSGPNGTSPYGIGKIASCMLKSITDSVSGHPIWSALVTYWEPFNPQAWLQLSINDQMDAGAGYWLFSLRNATYAPSTMCPIAA